MNWDDHIRWAKKFGISEDAADYVNRIIDCSETEQLPDEYLQSIQDAAETIATERGATRGNSALDRVIAADTMGHDSGRRKPTRGDLAAECTVQHLHQKGGDFVDAWYLHHHLDYLYEHRATDNDLEDLITRYGTEYPEAHSTAVETFLLDHVDALADDLEESTCDTPESCADH